MHLCSLIRAFACRLNILYLEFLRLKGGSTGSSESTIVKMPHCWKSHVTAHMQKVPNSHELAYMYFYDSKYTL